MARPKKAPRVRLQITLPKPLAKTLRRFCKERERELSEVVAKSLAVYFSGDFGSSPVDSPAFEKVALSRANPFDPLADLTQPELIPRPLGDS